jgi:hypothetical protein
MSKFKEFLGEFIDNAKAKIAELALSELDNADKKQALDEFITEKVIEKVGNGNSFKVGLLNKFIIPYIPTVTQFIYDLLKENIMNVTK